MLYLSKKPGQVKDNFQTKGNLILEIGIVYLINKSRLLKHIHSVYWKYK